MSPPYLALTSCVPDPATTSASHPDAEPEAAVSSHDAATAPSIAIRTVPVGALTCPPLPSETLAVQLLFAPAGTGVTHVSVVADSRRETRSTVLTDPGEIAEPEYAAVIVCSPADPEPGR